MVHTQTAIPGRNLKLPLLLFTLTALIWFLFWNSLCRGEKGNDHKTLIMCFIKSRPHYHSHLYGSILAFWFALFATPVCRPALEVSFSVQKVVCGAMHATAPSLLQRGLPNFSFLVNMELLFCSIDNSLDTIKNERKLKLCLFFSSASLSALGFKYWELHTTDNTTEVFLLSKKPLFHRCGLYLTSSLLSMRSSRPQSTFS